MIFPGISVQHRPQCRGSLRWRQDLGGTFWHKPATILICKQLGNFKKGNFEWIFFHLANYKQGLSPMDLTEVRFFLTLQDRGHIRKTFQMTKITLCHWSFRLNWCPIQSFLNKICFFCLTSSKTDLLSG